MDAVERYIEQILSNLAPECPAWNVERMHSGAKPHWNYIDGCMLRALWRLGETRRDARYARYVRSFVDYYVGEDGALLGYDEGEYNLDNILEGNAPTFMRRRAEKSIFLASNGSSGSWRASRARLRGAIGTS
ncbi:MAG TPA: hypothetical protein VN540_05055 [Clostridia bacterium]|nr:hypothetical protein [Clostridia bacterium]